MSKFCAPSWISERPDSRDTVIQGVNSTQRRQYHIRATSDSEAYALLTITAPPQITIEGIPLEGTPEFQIVEQSDGGGTHNIYVGTARYQHAQRDEQTGDELIEENDERVTFSFGTVSPFFSYAPFGQTSWPAEGFQQRDHHSYINVKLNGEVQGVQVDIPPNTFSVTKVFPEATVTNDWLRERLDQRGTINNDVFRTLQPGDVMLTSISGQQRSDMRWDITYDFAVELGEENVTSIHDISLGETIRIDGFQYVWLLTEPEEDAGADNVLVPISLQAHVADLFRPTSFAALGIDV